MCLVQKCYEDALLQFEQNTDFQSMYQLGVMYYDGLGTPPNSVSCNQKVNIH